MKIKNVKSSANENLKSKSKKWKTANENQIEKYYNIFKTRNRKTEALLTSVFPFVLVDFDLAETSHWMIL